MIKLTDILYEVREQYLYHFTYDISWKMIKSEDRLIVQLLDYDRHDDSDDSYERVPYISLTRDKNLWDKFDYSVRLTLNYSKLKNRYKIVPYRDVRFAREESEERIYKDIYPLSDYLVKVDRK